MEHHQKLEKQPVSNLVHKLKQVKQELIEQHTRDLEQLDLMIANLEKLPTGKKAINNKGNSKSNGLMYIEPSWPMVPGGARGMRMPEAVHAFLANFTSPVPFSDLMSALQRGGVDLGDPAKPQRYQANVKTTVMNNRKRFRYDKRKDTVVLLREHATV
jgi:hypothetical protein